MKPPPFDYIRPSCLEEALTALHTYGEDAKPLAGGQSLVPMLNLRLARPEVLIDVNDLDLEEIRRDNGDVRLGALVRHARLVTDPTVVAEVPLLAVAATQVGHPAIRNRGTLGGSLAHADPTAELALAALALDATIEAASVRGTRTIAAQDLFAGTFTTTLEDDELIVSVRWPGRRPDDRWGFQEVAERSGDFALAAAACRLRVVEGRVAAARVVVAGATPAPRVLPEIEASLLGELVDASLSAHAVEACPHLDGRGDAHASGQFRAQLMRVVVERAVDQAAGAGETA